MLSKNTSREELNQLGNEIINQWLEYLLPLIKAILKDYKHNNFSIEILDLAKRARVKMNDVRTNTTHVLGQFSGVRDRLSGSLNTIQLECERLESLN